MLTLNKKIKAFSLLEMVMVIIIIGVLIASISYFKPNNDPIKEQKEFGKTSATKLFDEIKTAQLEIIRNTSRDFGTEKLTLQSLTIKTIEKVSNILKIDKQYNKDHIEHLELGYKDKNYINKVVGLNGEKEYININSNNSFNNNGILETRVYDIETQKIQIPISQIKFNKAAQTISQYFCDELKYYEEKGNYECLKREK